MAFHTCHMVYKENQSKELITTTNTLFCLLVVVFNKNNILHPPFFSVRVLQWGQLLTLVLREMSHAWKSCSGSVAGTPSQLDSGCASRPHAPQKGTLQ